jgi:hypothetical protein
VIGAGVGRARAKRSRAVSPAVLSSCYLCALTA